MTDKTAPSFQKALAFRKFDFPQDKSNMVVFFGTENRCANIYYIKFQRGIFLRMTGAEMVVKTLEKNGVKVVFGYPGAANCPIIDKLSFSSIKHILTRNEQGAAHMASGYARVTKQAGVCTATSGPGATNLITGIATAYMDSIPMVALTGQVATKLIGKDAFQEVDITGATLPLQSTATL